MVGSHFPGGSFMISSYIVYWPLDVGASTTNPARLKRSARGFSKWTEPPDETQSGVLAEDGPVEQPNQHTYLMYWVIQSHMTPET